MQTTPIKFDFPEYKLKAIEQALADKQEQTTIEKMLLEHVNGLYEKNVPTQARKYLDAMLGDPSQTAHSQQTGQPPAAAPDLNTPIRRPYTRRSQTAQQQEAAQTPAVGQAGPEQESQESAQEPELGMTM